MLHTDFQVFLHHKHTRRPLGIEDVAEDVGCLPVKLVSTSRCASVRVSHAVVVVVVVVLFPPPPSSHMKTLAPAVECARVPL